MNPLENNFEKIIKPLVLEPPKASIFENRISSFSGKGGLTNLICIFKVMYLKMYLLPAIIE
jgi:hypothetical protein